MNSALKRLAERVMSDYPTGFRGIRLIHAAESKAIWKIEAGNRTYGLKRFKYGKDRMLFAIQAQKHLQDRGGPVASVIPARDDMPYSERNGQVFILYEWIDGRKPDFANASDLSQAVRLLARFHRASSGFRPSARCRESSKRGKWPLQYESMEGNMKRWQNSKADSNAASALKPYWTDLIRLAGQARSELRNSGYEGLAASEPATLCHQDYSEGNVLLHGSGGTILDLDSVTYDFPARDLRKLILKRMQALGRWDSDLFGRIMSHYRKQNPLNEQQLRLVTIDLMFPHLLHETAKNPFQNASPVPKSKLLAAIRIEREKEKALSKWPWRK